MTGCRYITSLDRPCGRDQTHGQHCAFHAVLHEFETTLCEDVEMTIGHLRDRIGALNDA